MTMLFMENIFIIDDLVYVRALSRKDKNKSRSSYTEQSTPCDPKIANLKVKYLSECTVREINFTLSRVSSCYLHHLTM